LGWATHHIDKLRAGETVSFRPRGSSMRGRIESGQLCTVEPIDAAALTVGDIVLCRVRGNDYLHIVKAIQVGHRRRRPAANETLLDCCRVRRHRGRSSLGAVKPEYKLDPGLLEHPRLSPRAVMAPEHAW